MADSTYKPEIARHDPDAAPQIKLRDLGDSTYASYNYNIAVGETSDARETDPDATNTTVIALLRAILYRLENGVDVNII